MAGTAGSEEAVEMERGEGAHSNTAAGDLSPEDHPQGNSVPQAPQGEPHDPPRGILKTVLSREEGEPQDVLEEAPSDKNGSGKGLGYKERAS